MSSNVLDRIADDVRESAVSLAWAQWATLGSAASSQVKAKALVDPEVLVLLSLTLRQHERRLWDVLCSWIPVGVRLLSVQRIKNLAREFPLPTTTALSQFASLAVSEGKDARWRSLAESPSDGLPPGRGKEWNVTGGFIEAPALMLRLRLGLGVGLRADALSFLLARQGEWLPVRAIAASLCYTEAATRRALENLSAARLIHATAEGQPTTYFADANPWCDILGIDTPPKWRGWFETFVLLADLDQMWQSTEARTATEYAARALLRQSLSKHRAAFVGFASGDMHLQSKKLDIEDIEQLLQQVTDSV
jgi:hypothetical protein